MSIVWYGLWTPLHLKWPHQQIMVSANFVGIVLLYIGHATIYRFSGYYVYTFPHSVSFRVPVFFVNLMWLLVRVPFVVPEK